MSWNRIKKHTHKADMEAWCEEMGIKDYTINSKGEIDVSRSVDLSKMDFKELPYKFGTVNEYFDVGENEKLTSLKNCPDYVADLFACNLCPQLDSLEGCPKEVKSYFYCGGCKRRFTKEEVRSLCKVNGTIIK